MKPKKAKPKTATMKIPETLEGPPGSYCSDCSHFTPEVVNPVPGFIGTCAVKQTHVFGFHNCAKWKAA